MGYAELVTAAARAAQAHLGGTTVAYRPKLGSPLFVAVEGIFDENFVLVTADENTGVEMRGPALFVLKPDLPTDPDFDDPVITVTAASVATDYKVVERRTDGADGVVLILRLVD